MSRDGTFQFHPICFFSLLSFHSFQLKHPSSLPSFSVSFSPKFLQVWLYQEHSHHRWTVMPLSYIKSPSQASWKDSVQRVSSLRRNPAAGDLGLSAGGFSDSLPLQTQEVQLLGLAPSFPATARATLTLQHTPSPKAHQICSHWTVATFARMQNSDKFSTKCSCP